MSFIRYLKIAGYLLALLLLLAACSQDEPEAVAPQTEAVAPTAAIQTPTISQSPTPTAAPTASPTPTPVQSVIMAQDQPVDDAGQILISEVAASEPSWLVLHINEGDQPGAVLATMLLDEGRHQNITLTIDPLLVTPDLLAVLYPADAGQEEFVYDLNLAAAALAATPFTVDIQIAIPAIAVSDQEVDMGGEVWINRVVSPGDGWLLLYSDNAGEADKLLAIAPVRDGVNEDILMTINWWEATPRLHVTLHHDAGELGRFEPEHDLPVEVQGNPITAFFDLLLPPDIYVLHQPVVDDAIIIERAVSYGPGWAVVYYDEDDQPGRIIGYAPLEDGVNEQVVVPIASGLVTAQLFVRLHEDGGAPGEFNPNEDPPVLFQGALPEPASFRIDLGSYLIAREQAIGEEDTIMVELVVVAQPAWVVIRADEEGQPGAILGQRLLDAGINRNILVPLETTDLTETLYIALHSDNAPFGEFNYPDGEDAPLTRNNNPIILPLTLLE